MKYTFSDKISSLKPSAIREILKMTSDPNIISFAAGNPAPDAFPVEEIRRITADILEKNPIAALQYSVTEGYAPLRDAVKARLSFPKRTTLSSHRAVSRLPSFPARYSSTRATHFYAKAPAL